MKLILSVFFAALMLLSAQASAQADDLALIAKKDQEMLRPTVRIDTEHETGSSSVIYARRIGEGAQCGTKSPQGKQMCISGVLLLTNHHVIGGSLAATKHAKSKKGASPATAGQVDLTFYEYSGSHSDQLTAHEFKGTVIAWDKKRDLALVHAENVPERIVAVAALAPRDAKPLRHAKAWKSGSTAGYEPLITEGAFGSIDLRPEQVAPLITSTPMSSGNSGGGVYHFSRGRFEMIAVLAEFAKDSKKSTIEHLAFSIMIQTVHDFLAENGLSFVSEWHAAQPR